jgi:hypothetical protein
MLLLGNPNFEAPLAASFALDWSPQRIPFVRKKRIPRPCGPRRTTRTGSCRRQVNDDDTVTNAWHFFQTLFPPARRDDYSIFWGCQKIIYIYGHFYVLYVANLSCFDTVFAPTRLRLFSCQTINWVPINHFGYDSLHFSKSCTH